MSWMLMHGDKLVGLYGGPFGRDYPSAASEFSRVESVGADWVVVRDESGQLWFAEGPDVHARLWPHCTRNHETAGGS